MKKYLLIILIITIPLIITGCTSKEEKYNMYKSDEKMITSMCEYLALMTEVTNDDSMSEEEKEYFYNLILEDIDGISMNTKEGKNIKKTYVKIADYYLNIAYQYSDSSTVLAIAENDSYMVELCNKINEQKIEFDEKYNNAQDKYENAGSIRKTIAITLGIIIGTIVFFSACSLFDLYCFGCGGVLGLWLITCYIVATLIGLILNVNV